jgi:pyridoxamine 5'-phosphate oxidase
VVRIEGRVSKVSDEESDAYFASRPLAHRIGAWASPQSEAIANRAVIVARAAEYGLKFGLKPPPAPLGRLPAGAGLLGILAGPRLAPA